MESSISTKNFRIGFDVGGTKMLAIVVAEDQTIIARKKRKTKGAEGQRDSLERICETIDMAVEQAGLDIANLKGIGIGCPGPIDMDKGIVQVAVNLGWKNFAIGEQLSKRFNCPTAVLNDVDAGVYGEYRYGAGVGSRCSVGIFPGTGIGGGCVYEGSILRGRRSSAMEIGHIRISSSDRSGGILMPGTLESEASRLAIAGECVKLAYRGEAPTILKLAGTDLSEIRSKVLSEAIKNGDVQVERTVKAAAEQIGYAALNMIHLLSPDTIVLGGGLVEAMKDIFIKGVEQVIDKYVLDCYRGTCKVVAAKLGDDAAALGAAGWVEKTMSPEFAKV
jgi:glucokinase